MKTFLLVLQIIVAVSLSGLILLQNSKGGLSSSVTGSEGYRTKRGAEKIVFTATIVFGVVFLAVSVGNLLLR